MKHGTLSKLQKRNTMTLNNFDDDPMAANYDFTVNFQIYGRFEVIRPATWYMILSLSCLLVFHVSLTLMLYITKSENRTKKFLTQPSCYCFEKRYYFCLKMLTFYEKAGKTRKI